MFKIGDIVEITAEAAATGMLDFKDGKGYEVESVQYYEYNSTGQPFRKDEQIRLTDESGVSEWYAASHFKLKEDLKVGGVTGLSIGDAVICIETDSYELEVNDITYRKEYVVKRSNRGCVQIVKDSGELGWFSSDKFKLKEDTIVEKKECLFKEGQVVWDVLYGKGRVYDISLEDTYCVSALFDNGVDDTFTLGGKHGEGYNRSLFFSEPKIEAATKPLCGTESLFTQGDSVLCRVFGQGTVLSISEEDDEVHVEFKGGGTRNYTLGGKLYDLFPDEVVTLSTVKQAFTPTLKYGDVVMAVDGSKSGEVIVVRKEDENVVTAETGISYWKSSNTFYRLGEKINFK